MIATPQTIKLLDQFIATHAERLVRDPVKRALFQLQLVGSVSLAERRHANGAPARRTRRRIAAIIKSIALTPEEIERLPHNFTPDMLAPEQREGWLLTSATTTGLRPRTGLVLARLTEEKMVGLSASKRLARRINLRQFARLPQIRVALTKDIPGMMYEILAKH